MNEVWERTLLLLQRRRGDCRMRGAAKVGCMRQTIRSPLPPQATRPSLVNPVPGGRGDCACIRQGGASCMGRGAWLTVATVRVEALQVIQTTSMFTTRGTSRLLAGLGSKGPCVRAGVRN